MTTYRLVADRYVSIHAPAGGATVTALRDHDDIVFQSTRPRGARLGSGKTTKNIQRFNPRARGGRDLAEMRDHDDVVFQSTRPRGARPDVEAVNTILSVSIHAPAGGATYLICHLCIE